MDDRYMGIYFISRKTKYVYMLMKKSWRENICESDQKSQEWISLERD